MKELENTLPINIYIQIFHENKSKHIQILIETVHYFYDENSWGVIGSITNNDGKIVRRISNREKTLKRALDGLAEKFIESI